MTFPFATRAPNDAEVRAIQLMLSSYRDGSGTERDPNGTTRPNWRQMERVISELFTGKPPPESKSIFDVIAPSLEHARTYYGLSIKSKQLSKRKFDNLTSGARTYMEIANSPAKMFASLERKHGLTIEDFRAGASPEVVGNCVLETVREWHEDGKAIFERQNPGANLDLEHSIYLCLSYRAWENGAPRRYQLHSFSLEFPGHVEWRYQGKSLRGYDPDFPKEVLFDWYGESGGQLKYYPKATTAHHASSVFSLVDAQNIDLFEKAASYWPEEWNEVEAGLHPSLVRRNLEE